MAEKPVVVEAPVAPVAIAPVEEVKPQEILQEKKEEQVSITKLKLRNWKVLKY